MSNSINNNIIVEQDCGCENIQVQPATVATLSFPEKDCNVSNGLVQVTHVPDYNQNISQEIYSLVNENELGSQTQTCIEGQIGITAPVKGLSTYFAVGPGFEDKVEGTGTNFLHWDYLHPAMYDSTVEYTPTIETRCDGTTIERPNVYTTIVKDPTGEEKFRYVNPLPNLLAGLVKPLKFRIQTPFLNTDNTIDITAAAPIQVIGGDGLQIVPVSNGFKISVSNAVNKTTVTSPAASGIIVTKSTSGDTFNLALNYGTIRVSGGFITSVNGQQPDANGNVTLNTGSFSQGITTVTTQNNTGLSVATPASGIARIDVDATGLKTYLGLTNNVLGIQFPINSGITTTTTNNVVSVGIDYSQFATNGGLQKAAANGQGTPNQVLVSNGDGTTKWVNLCDLLTLLGCGSNNTIVIAAPTAPASPAQTSGYAQAPSNGGNINGSTAYNNGVPYLIWGASTTNGVNYTVKDITAGTTLASNLTGTSYVIPSFPGTGSRTYAVYATLNSSQSGAFIIGPINIAS